MKNHWLTIAPKHYAFIDTGIVTITDGELPEGYCGPCRTFNRIQSAIILDGIRQKRFTLHTTLEELDEYLQENIA